MKLADETMIVESFNSMDGLAFDQQFQRVGIDPDGATFAGIAYAATALPMLAAAWKANRGDNDAIADAINAHVVAAYTAGVMTGARLAQAGLAVACEDVAA